MLYFKNYAQLGEESDNVVCLVSPIYLIKHTKSTQTDVHTHTRKKCFFENFDLIIQIILSSQIWQKISPNKKAKYKRETECI